MNDDVVGDRLIAGRIKCENVSVNWSKYSKPWDVIFDQINCGIAQFFHCRLPQNLPTHQPTERSRDQVQPHSFVAKHMPEVNNFSHSEIRTEKAGVMVERFTSSTVKKEFQVIMSDRSFVILNPKK